MTLFVNCCPRGESRTRLLADAVLKKSGSYEEINLYQASLRPLNAERLQIRNVLLAENRLDAVEFALARQFAAADRIVIAAPFWDLSFPSMLKLYVENIYIMGIVSSYDARGIPQGLCRARELCYVTTAGGSFDGRFGFDYLKTLCRDYFGIPEVRLIKAEMLDVEGNNPAEIIKTAIEGLR